MAKFIPTFTDSEVNFYGGGRCSIRNPAETDNPFYIDKARANPDFAEVVAEQPKAVKKKATRKKAKKKVAKKS